MEEEELEKQIDYFHPIRMNTMGIPQEHDLLMAYDVYQPALETRKLRSERNRSLYAEIFIENIKLGPLRDLCTRVLASTFTPEQMPSMVEDPLKLRLYYDALSLDLPLDECYHITDEKYWRRFVLAKNKDGTLAFKKEHEYDWRSLGLSMKFVELVEACPAEYWPDDEMRPLAMKIKDYVSEMHIRKLQSMSERYFRDRIHLDESDETESDSTDVESITVTPISTEASLDNMGEEEEEELEEGKNAHSAVKHNTDFSELYLNSERVQKANQETDDEEEDAWKRFHQDILDERKERTRVLREAQQERRAEREERRRIREALK
ncbi:PREDICTED: uncharacterized protein LOC108355650, partial [Rhagoletis zephyria]|uniref:uncharacterized protein LOC108355650 n=1 Tax=Rhagoletis zephyria TaxID=28612 RepID=UPI0008115FCD